MNDIHNTSLSMINDWLDSMSDEEFLSLHKSLELNIGPSIDEFCPFDTNGFKKRPKISGTNFLTAEFAETIEKTYLSSKSNEQFFASNDECYSAQQVAC